MFKGSKNHTRDKGNNVDQLLERTGAKYNATTWLDRANYYETWQRAPVHRGGHGGRPHAQPAATRGRSQARNDGSAQRVRAWRELPIQALYKGSTSLPCGPPYHHSTIGHRSDIEKVSIAKLREFTTPSTSTMPP